MITTFNSFLKNKIILSMLLDLYRENYKLSNLQVLTPYAYGDPHYGVLAPYGQPAMVCDLPFCAYES